MELRFLFVIWRIENGEGKEETKEKNTLAMEETFSITDGGKHGYKTFNDRNHSCTALG